MEEPDERIRSRPLVPVVENVVLDDEIEQMRGFRFGTRISVFSKNRLHDVSHDARKASFAFFLGEKVGRFAPFHELGFKIPNRGGEFFRGERDLFEVLSFGRQCRAVVRVERNPGFRERFYQIQNLFRPDIRRIRNQFPYRFYRFEKTAVILGYA